MQYAMNESLISKQICTFPMILAHAFCVQFDLTLHSTVAFFTGHGDKS
jgi:hypothetical protein